MSQNTQTLREELKQIAKKFQNSIQPKDLIPGTDYLPAAGKVVGLEEFLGLLEASCDMWLTAGRFADSFEAKFANFWELKKSLLVNSGSSANLLAFATLTSPKLKEQALQAGDEFISPACGFPTTVSPALQYGLKPVFVDVDPVTHNVSVETIKNAITSKTKLIMIAHALGNPYRADELAQVCAEKGIWLIEDCCDALGAKIGDKNVGSFGSLATCSFYPAHHMTMGEGGSVLTNSTSLYKIALSMRDWGRDCWCPPGTADTCGIRFDWQLGSLPKGYDHKYIYSHLGYNLKATDFQAVLGLVQLERVRGFIEKRKENHAYLGRCLKELKLDEDFILPEATPGTTPSWFGYFLTYREGEKDRRKKTLQFLEKNKIGTRLLFGGNLTRQPAFAGLDYKIHGELVHTDKIMSDGFWIGIWPGLGEKHLDYMASKLKEAVRL